MSDLEEVEAEVIDDTGVSNTKYKGRLKGSVSKRTRAVLNRAAATGVAPIEVMLDNMRWWHKEAQHALRVVNRLLASASVKMDNESQVGELCETIALLAKFRDKSQECAVDAAPYMHPKLGSIVLKGDAENPLFVQLKVEELRNDLAGRIARLSHANSEDEIPPGSIN